MRRAVQSCNAGVSAADLGSAAARGICHTQAGRYRAAVAIAHCRVGDSNLKVAAPSVQLATKCAKLGQDGQDFSLPARRQIYALPDKTLMRDSTRPDFQLPDEAAQNAYDYAGLVDDYFRSLSAQGVGAWDGCYGKAMRPIMPSYVHLSPEFNNKDWLAGWDGDANAVYYKDLGVAPDVALHEWTHALVGRTVNMESDGGLNNQTGGLYESLADTFAVLFRNDGTFTISSKLGVRRDMANPAATSQAAHMVDFDNPHDLDRDEYYKAGIPSKAVHLMLVGGSIS